ncbi:cyclic nucleotide-binding domain-containing protein [Streptomyces sp. 549]|uniref:Crp/Fnr family transcriptional regulator n=1 Tax=Streptomyces sp. 549 TaxID=3049076 RepID=UPI0024C444DB|nr:cyclic nucleotide-binding domain-containing protein [Streptomyces sp. 549]MDK1472240.1 cyclic nucleotide-binding domain-containing protein [Streptomyces sp. 549]
MRTMKGFFGSLPPGHRDRLRALGRDVTFEAGTRIFDEGRRADRFWVVHSGSVALDMHVPGRQPVVVETIGHGELLGWSWLFDPFSWHLGAEAVSPVRAHEYDAEAVRLLCREDSELGQALTLAVAGVISHRLQRARSRLLDVYGPYASPRSQL